MRLTTRLEPRGDDVVVVLEGDVDLATVVTLRDALTSAGRDHPTSTLTIDLDGVTSLDDAGLGVLLGTAGSRRAAGHDLRVVCSRPVLVDRLRLTGFDRAVTVAASLSELASGDLPPA